MWITLRGEAAGATFGNTEITPLSIASGVVNDPIDFEADSGQEDVPFRRDRQSCTSGTISHACNPSHIQIDHSAVLMVLFF